MEITGKVIKILSTQKFVSKKNGKEYVKGSFVVETNGQYPKHVVFSVMGEDKMAKMALVVGGSYNISFDVDAREYQGRWYNDISAWRAVRVDGQNGGVVTSPPAGASPQGVIPAEKVSVDKLPF